MFWVQLLLSDSDADDDRRKTIQRCVNCANINTLGYLLEGAASWQVTGNVLRFATSSCFHVFAWVGVVHTEMPPPHQLASQSVSQLGRSNLERELVATCGNDVSSNGSPNLPFSGEWAELAEFWEYS